jgi:hypothetical protein
VYATGTPQGRLQTGLPAMLTACEAANPVSLYLMETPVSLLYNPEAVHDRVASKGSRMQSEGHCGVSHTPRALSEGSESLSPGLVPRSKSCDKSSNRR